jgi:hypothetical protein
MATSRKEWHSLNVLTVYGGEDPDQPDLDGLISRVWEEKGLCSHHKVISSSELGLKFDTPLEDLIRIIRRHHLVIIRGQERLSDSQCMALLVVNHLGIPVLPSNHVEAIKDTARDIIRGQEEGWLGNPDEEVAEEDISFGDLAVINNRFFRLCLDMPEKREDQLAQIASLMQ